MIKTIFVLIRNKYVRRSSKSLISYYKRKGIRIGNNCIFRSTGSVRIDLTRPSLISIGDNVDMNKNFTIMTHDFSHRVFIALYGEFLSSSGRVKIGNNIYFGSNVTVLKGVEIGDNCIIGAGSIVTKDIPANSVASGIPCKVICSIEEYYEKRKRLWVNEALSYAKTIRKVENREPTIKDFQPEFGLYVDKHNINEYDSNIIKKRLKTKYHYWLDNHIAPFDGFEDFLKNSKQDE